MSSSLKLYGDYSAYFNNFPQPLEAAAVIPREPETL